MMRELLLSQPMSVGIPTDAYRKSHEIESAAGAGTDYQVKVVIHKGAGVDGGEDVYCDDHCLDDFGDIRFTESDGVTELPYRLESYTNGVSAIFWVKVAEDLSAVDRTIYMYYGKVGAETSSSGLATFPELFEQFDDLYPKTIYDPATFGCIVKIGDTYHMFPCHYSNGNTDEIHRATSTDLENWTDQGAVTFVGDGLTGRNDPEILKDFEDNPLQYDGKYWMVAMEYTATLGNIVFKLYSAPSIDGTWTYDKDVLTKGAGGEWDDSHIFAHCFFKEGDTYYIFYHGKKVADGKSRIGYATCATPDGTWAKAVDNPRLEPLLAFEGNATVDPVVRKEGDTYYLFYTGDAGANSKNSRATSASLSGAWVKSGEQINRTGISYPQTVLHTDGLWYIIGDDIVPTPHRKTITGAAASLADRFMDWNKSGAPTIVGSQLLINADGENISSLLTHQYKALRAKVKFASEAADNDYQYFGFQAHAAGLVLNCEMFFTGEGVLYVYSGEVGAGNWERTDIYDAAYFDAYHIWEILWKSDLEAKFYVDDVLKATHTTHVCDSEQPIGFYDYATSADLYVDWVLIRKYVSPEPVHGAWGAEEAVVWPF